MPSYSNYRWEPANARKGDRFYYKRDVVWMNMSWRPTQSQLIASVTYNGDHTSPHWGKWHVNFGAQSPGLQRLRLQEKPNFSSKQEAIAWATAMVTLEGLS